MKRVLTILFFLIFHSLPAYAELRVVAISCKAIVKEDSSGSKIITGFTYSLYTGIPSEEVKNVTLKGLLPKIEQVAWAGSSIEVAIFSDYTLNTQSLKSIIHAIEKNIHMELVYVENGQNSSWGEHIKEVYDIP